MSESTKQIYLLKVEIKDRYSQENFKRIEDYLNKVVCKALDDLADSSGGGGASVVDGEIWSEGADTVNASSTKTVDTHALADFNSIVYHLTLYNTVQGVSKKLTVTIVDDNGTIRKVVSSKLGSTINYRVNANKVGSNLELSIVNNEAYNLDISYARLIH